MRIFASLSNRIFFASAALTVLCMSAAIYLVNARVTAASEEELRRNLEQAGAVVEQQRATVTEVFAVLARLVADLPKFKAAVDTNDPATVRPVVEGYKQQLHADLFLVISRSGQVLASLAPHGITDEENASLPTVSAALAGHESAMFCLYSGDVMQVVSVPITAGAEPPDIVGTLTVGFLLDDALAARFKELTGSEIAFAAGRHVVASTLPTAARASLDRLIGQSGLSRVTAGGDEYLAVTRPLRPSTQTSLFGGTTGSGPSARANGAGAVLPSAIILRSRTERLRLLRPIQVALIATGIVAMALGVGLSYLIARSITRPLAVITDTMKEMAATGDLTTKIAWPTSKWQDEDAQLLARTFNTLTASVTRFQREAAERERLSALGRLSTVIAHEVRNPLMIIRASLQPLMRPDAPSADVREAAQDIDEEVTRLNRLVNEVLDFARPLRFDIAPTDINRVCRDSAEAAAAGHEACPIQLHLDPSLPGVMTDAERLRAALVNVLVNARQAVAARPAEGGACPNGAVYLRSEALPGDGVAIIVKDDGVGIAAADIAHVFEPYFTTKRTGSGLGLAIARNIVEGLGGRIRIASRQGAGTEIRIELPSEAPGSGPGRSF